MMRILILYQTHLLHNIIHICNGFEKENLLDNQSFLSSSYYFLYSRELFVLFRVTLLEEKKMPVILRD